MRVTNPQGLLRMGSLYVCYRQLFDPLPPDLRAGLHWQEEAYPADRVPGTPLGIPTRRRKSRARS